MGIALADPPVGIHSSRLVICGSSRSAVDASIMELVPSTTSGRDLFADPPLVSEIQAIVDGKAQLPSSSARRHHFVPAFALARFAEPPGSRKGWMYQLDVRSGTPERTRPDDAAFVKDLYTYEDNQGDLSRSVESFFSIVEKHAAPALDRLCEDPGSISPQDRLTIAFFLALQESRTPEGLIRTERMRQAAFELKASMGLSSLEAFREEFKCDITQSMSLDELEVMRKRMQNQLLEGRVRYESPRTGAMAQIMKVASEIAEEIFSLDWIVLTADGAEFVTSDRPIAMVDHAPEHPWSGNAWRSSAKAISFYPLSPTKGLFMMAGDHGLTVATSERSQIRRLNLMVYGWRSASYTEGRKRWSAKFAGRPRVIRRT